MLTVHKFPLPGTSNKVVLDHSAKILDVQYQGDQLVMWALVDPERSAIERTFEVFGTGWDLPPAKWTYIATVQAHNGLVWHIFERVQL